MVIAKLLSKDKPQQIGNLNDLRQMTQFKILVKKNSFAEDLFAKSESVQDLKSRIVLEEFELSDPRSLHNVIGKILTQDVVLVDEEHNFENYISVLPKNQFQLNDFFMSDTIERLPGAWVFPKGPEHETLKHKITVRLQYLVDIGLYQYYSDSVAKHLFRHLGAIQSVSNESIEVTFAESN